LRNKCGIKGLWLLGIHRIPHMEMGLRTRDSGWGASKNKTKKKLKEKKGRRLEKKAAPFIL